jgi:hypothetical protein
VALVLEERPLRFTPIIEEARPGVTFEGSLAIGEELFGKLEPITMASPGGIEPSLVWPRGRFGNTVISSHRTA